MTKPARIEPLVPSKNDRQATVKFSVSVPRDVVEEVRYAVWLRGHEDNLSRFTTEALERLLALYRRQYNGGKPFRLPAAPVKLKHGRPMKPPRRP